MFCTIEERTRVCRETQKSQIIDRSESYIGVRQTQRKMPVGEGVPGRDFREHKYPNCIFRLFAIGA